MQNRIRGMMAPKIYAFKEVRPPGCRNLVNVKSLTTYEYSPVVDTTQGKGDLLYKNSSEMKWTQDGNIRNIDCGCTTSLHVLKRQTTFWNWTWYVINAQRMLAMPLIHIPTKITNEYGLRWFISPNWQYKKGSSRLILYQNILVFLDASKIFILFFGFFL